MFLIYSLIIVFLMLISYDIILAFFPQKVIEGLENESSNSTTQEYKPYNLNDPNNSLILAQQNAGNIEVLKGRIDNLDGVKQKVDDIQENINSMQTQIDGLVQQQADYAQQLAGSSPADISGTESNTTANVESSIEEENK